MGMEQSVRFDSKAIPAWSAFKAFLDGRGFPIQLRMIDGELAFPEENPPESWRELRVAMAQGMVTLRRENDRIVLVTWGNADAALLQAWNGLVWAIAEVGGGRVESASGLATPAEYLRSADMPPALRGEA
jgi:hypothetical protein